jgi:SAM-dependent methyltransferase
VTRAATQDVTKERAGIVEKTAAHRTLQEIGDDMHRRGIFTGGPPEQFELLGRMQFAIMVREGVYPWSRVLDIGCGCLRGGFWMIHFLDRGCYFGIEPNTEMVEAGSKEIVGQDTIEEKCPTIDFNDQFDASVFGVRFDAFLARSIWTHAAKPQIRTMLDHFVNVGTENAFFLASYLPAKFPWQDYKGVEYRGKSHKSNVGDLVCHSYKWIERECQTRRLFIRELPDGILLGQKWLKISKKPIAENPYRI